MKAIVFGGTGFIGSHVVEQLYAAGHQVTVAVRNTSHTGFLDSLGIPTVPFDADDLMTISHAIQGHDVVFNCTADLQGGTKNHAGEPVEIYLTKALLKAAALRDVNRFIQLSSIITYDFRSNEPMNEMYNTEPEYPVQRLALERERLVLNEGTKSGMATYIVRPASTIGVRDVHSFFSRMFRAHVNNQYLMVGDGHAKLSVIDTRDIGRAMNFLAFESVESDAGIYLVKGFDTSWNEIKEIIDKFRGVKSVPIYIPDNLTDDQLPKYGLTSFAYQNFKTNRIWNDQKLRNLGFHTTYSFTDSVNTASADLVKRSSL